MAGTLDAVTTLEIPTKIWPEPRTPTPIIGTIVHWIRKSEDYGIVCKVFTYSLTFFVSLALMLIPLLGQSLFILGFKEFLLQTEDDSKQLFFKQRDREFNQDFLRCSEESYKEGLKQSKVIYITNKDDTDALKEKYATLNTKWKDAENKASDATQHAIEAGKTLKATLEENTAFKQQIQLLRKENEQLIKISEEFKRLKGEYDSLKLTTSEQKTDLSLDAQKFTELQTEVKNLQKQLDEITNKMRESLTREGNLKIENESFKKNKDELERRLTEISDVSEKTKAQLNRQIEQLRKQIEDLRKKPGSTDQKQLDKAIEQNQNLLEKNGDLKKEINKLNIRFQGIEPAEFKRIQKDLESAKSRIGELEAEIDKLSKNRAEADELIKVQAQLKSTLQSKEDLERQLEALKEKLVNLNKIFEQNAGFEEKMLKEKLALEEQIKNLKIQLKELKTTLETEKRTLGTKITTLEETLKETEIERDEHYKEKTEMIDNYREVKEELEEVKKEAKETASVKDRALSGIQHQNINIEDLVKTSASLRLENEQLKLEMMELKKPSLNKKVNASVIDQEAAEMVLQLREQLTIATEKLTEIKEKNAKMKEDHKKLIDDITAKTEQAVTTENNRIAEGLQKMMEDKLLTEQKLSKMGKAELLKWQASLQKRINGTLNRQFLANQLKENNSHKK